MNEIRRLLDTENDSSPSPDDNPGTIGAGRALAGILLTTVGLVIMLVGGALIKQPHGLGKDILGEDATIVGMWVLYGTGILTLAFGGLLGVAGVFLFGKRGKFLMVRFGCLLVFAGIATYFGDLILNDGPNKVVRLVGLLAALLGIVLIAAANGWLNQGRGGLFDDLEEE